MEHHLTIVVILAVGFSLASLFGYIMQRLKLPAMLGFLLAGYVIGPYSPGFVANLQLAEELATIGVILMLFGVGLHFRLDDLIKVKNIAIPGAIGQTLMASVVGSLVIHLLGWELEDGIIIGVAISVASTVVLVRMLNDNQLIDTLQGHIAVGWLIVEDLITVAMLLLLPSYAAFITGYAPTVLELTGQIFLVFIKFVILGVLILTIGQKVASYLLTHVARLRSHELFTITILALIFIVATTSAHLFGVSIALGAFLAGMVIGQTDVRHQAAANSLPVKDIFAVVFFLSVGMLFNPDAIMGNFGVFISVLGVILLFKPFIAWAIVHFMGYPPLVSLTVAISLAQIGEFSFILAEEAMQLKLLPDVGYDILVACALFSISLNPLLFRLLKRFEPSLVAASRRRKMEPGVGASPKFLQLFAMQKPVIPKVVIVGFGPVGQAVCDSLEKFGKNLVIIEQNIDTVPTLKGQDRKVVYGDASQAHILESAQVAQAKVLLITIPDVKTAKEIIHFARLLNPHIYIVVRVTYLSEIPLMEELKVKCICGEKEITKAFNESVYNLMKYI